MRTLFAALTAVFLGLAYWSVSAREFTPYSHSTFSEALSSGAPVLVHVHADWCPVCHRQAMILESLLEEPELASVKAVRIDYDLDREIVARLQVQNQSTVLVVVGGKVAAASAFQTNPHALRQQILDAL